MNESDTPRTDEAQRLIHKLNRGEPLIDLARKMERELNAARAELEDACFHLKCAGRLLETAALDEDGADGGECMEQKRNIDAFLLTQLNPAAFSSSEAFRVPEPHDMDCSSRRGDCCDCDRAKA